MVGSLGPRTADSEFRDRRAKKEKVRIFLFNQHPWIIFVQVAKGLDPSFLAMPGKPTAESLNPT